LNELKELLKRSESNLSIVIAMKDLNDPNNIIYILDIDDSSNSAGGRIGGFGYRKFKKIYAFKVIDNKPIKILEDNIDDIDIPYVARLPISIDNEEYMISCSIDSNLINLLNKRYNLS
jgi:hypothetical protein